MVLIQSRCGAGSTRLFLEKAGPGFMALVRGREELQSYPESLENNSAAEVGKIKGRGANASPSSAFSAPKGPSLCRLSGASRSHLYVFEFGGLPFHSSIWIEDSSVTVWGSCWQSFLTAGGCQYDAPGVLVRAGFGFVLHHLASVWPRMGCLTSLSLIVLSN